MIRPYHPDQDENAVIELWQAALGKTWPMRAEIFRHVVTSTLPLQRCEHFVAVDADRVIGFIAAQINPNHDGSVSANIGVLLISPTMQRRGTGTVLLTTMINHLREAGIQRVRIGGKTPRFWPGIPTNLPGANAFFAARGWQFSDKVYDLTRHLGDYATPDSLRQRMRDEQIAIEPAGKQDSDAILAFQMREFPGWLDTYRYVIGVGDYQDCLVARDPQKDIVGTLIMYSPQSNPRRVDTVWKTLLGENVGGLNEIGVAASERGRGIGLALVAWGSEINKARGVGNCLIGWTTLVDFYSKLGYRPWQEYNCAVREL